MIEANKAAISAIFAKFLKFGKAPASRCASWSTMPIG